MEVESSCRSILDTIDVNLDNGTLNYEYFGSKLSGILTEEQIDNVMPLFMVAALCK